MYRDLYIEDTSKSFKDGLALCAIIHRYRPDLIDFKSLNSAHVAANNQLAFDILEKEYGILPVSNLLLLFFRNILIYDQAKITYRLFHTGYDRNRNGKK